MGDIYYCNGERMARNRSNGGFTIESDDYEQFFKSQMFGLHGGADRDAKLTAKDVAEQLFNVLIEAAGLSHG